MPRISFNKRGTKATAKSRKKMQRRLIKQLGPKQPGSRHMDKIDLILFPFVYLFWMTLTVLSLAILITSSLSQIGNSVEPTSIWIVIFIYQILLSAIYHLHCILYFTFNILQTQWLALALWSWLFWHLFGPSSSGQTIWQILTNANGICTSPPLDPNQEPT